MEALRMVPEGGLLAIAVSSQLSLPKSSIGTWLRAFRAGKLEGICKSHRPLSDVEGEPARLKRGLALV